MKPLIRFTSLIFIIFLPLSEVWAADEEFDAADCDITAVEPIFTLVTSRYNMGGLCNGVHSFTLSVYWDHRFGSVQEQFESDQYGGGYLSADCPKDPVLFDGDCKNLLFVKGVHLKNNRLISRDRLTQEQKALLKQELDSMVPPPSIDNPVSGEFYDEQYLMGDDQYRIPLRLTIADPAVGLKFQLLALVVDD